MDDKKQKASAKNLLAGITDSDLHSKLEETLDNRKTARRLSAIRALKNLSQADVAKEMGCSQSRVSKLECSDDDKWSIEDLRSYSGAVGYSVRLGVVPEDLEPTDEVKFLTFAIENRMTKLTELAKHDDEIAGGVSAFFYELFLNFGTILSAAADQIPALPDGSRRFECTIRTAEISTGDPDVQELISGDTAAL